MSIRLLSSVCIEVVTSKFERDFADIVYPLHNLMRKSAAFRS